MQDVEVATARAVIADSPLAADGDTQAKKALFESFVVTAQHFFGGLGRIFATVHDPRDPDHITYPLPVVMATGVLLFLFRLGARRQIKHWLRENESVAAKYQLLFGVPTCPHGDTLNYLYARTAVDEVQAVVTDMTHTLIRRKVLYRHRLLDKYFLVAIDGTGMLTFSERHCEHCMTRTVHGQTLYYHPVLEAKLVTANGWAFSLLTEFIENPSENPTKQDCELKAFYRLVARLKERFPRLPLCLLLDGLFAGGPTFTLCETYHWKYLIVLQEDDIPYINDEFRVLSPLAPENHVEFHTGVQSEIRQDLRWVNDIDYQDSKRQLHRVAVLECWEDKPRADQEQRATRFKWVTNFRVTPHNVVTLANQGGRLRWKIENEGFNVQKNGGYALEHVYTQDDNAAKIFYLLLQIAHLLAILIQDGSLFRRAFPDGVGSAKNLASRLLEAWRNLHLSPAELLHMLNLRRQIRFIPP
jgi:hypothetical protein